MEEELVQVLITAEGISESDARTIVAQMVEEIGDISIVLDLYRRSLAGDDLGPDAPTLAAIRNEVSTILAEIGGPEPRAQEVLRQQFDQLVQEEFGDVTPPEQEALDEIFRQMFRDFRSTGRTDFDVFFDEQFDAITEDVQQGIAQGEATAAADALEQQRIAQATAAVANLRIPETLKAQIISDAVRQAEAEGLAGDVDEERFNGIVDELVGGLLNASPTAALELEAEAAQEDPLALSQFRRFDQDITDQEQASAARETALGDPALSAQFNEFLNAQLAAGTSREALAGLQGTDLISQFQAQQAAADAKKQAEFERRVSATQRAISAGGAGSLPQVGSPDFIGSIVRAGQASSPSVQGPIQAGETRRIGSEGTEVSFKDGRLVSRELRSAPVNRAAAEATARSILAAEGIAVGDPTYAQRLQEEIAASIDRQTFGNTIIHENASPSFAAAVTKGPSFTGGKQSSTGDFGDFLTQNVGPLETQKAVDERAKLAERRRNRITPRITAFG